MQFSLGTDARKRSYKGKILEKHLQHCVAEAVRGSSEKKKQQKLDEVIKLIRQTRHG